MAVLAYRPHSWSPTETFRPYSLVAADPTPSALSALPVSKYSKVSRERFVKPWSGTRAVRSPQLEVQTSVPSRVLIPEPRCRWLRNQTVLFQAAFGVVPGVAGDWAAVAGDWAAVAGDWAAVAGDWAVVVEVGVAAAAAVEAERNRRV